MKKFAAILLLAVMVTFCAGVQADELTAVLQLGATKYLDSKNPGTQRFAFMVWELTEQQMKELEEKIEVPIDSSIVETIPGLDDLLEFVEAPNSSLPTVKTRETVLDLPGAGGGTGDHPGLDSGIIIPPGFGSGDGSLILPGLGGGTGGNDDTILLPGGEGDSIPMPGFSKEELAKFNKQLRKELEKLPFTIVHNDDTEIPFIKKTFTEADDGVTKYYFIAEVHESGKPFVYDDAIYGFSVKPVKIQAIITVPLPNNPPPLDTPSRPEIGNNSNIVLPDPTLELVDQKIYCVTPENFLWDAWVDLATDPAEEFVFNNRSIPVVPVIPATGDSTNLALLAVFAAAGMIVMTLILRKKTKA